MTRQNELIHQRWISYQDKLFVSFLLFLGWVIIDFDIDLKYKIIIVMLLTPVFFIIFFYIHTKLKEAEKNL